MPGVRVGPEPDFGALALGLTLPFLRYAPSAVPSPTPLPSAGPGFGGVGRGPTGEVVETQGLGRVRIQTPLLEEAWPQVPHLQLC